MIVMQLNMISKSLSVEVSKFLSRFHIRPNADGSKQGYSKARSHIKWQGFVHLTDFFVKSYYEDGEYLRYKNKYILLASDGSTYELPHEESLIAEFNTFDNGQGQSRCLGQGVKLYDVLNHINIIAEFGAYNAGEGKGNSEQFLFEKCLDKLPQLLDKEQHNILLLGDRYYPSFYYFDELPRQGYNFLIRCSASFCHEVEAFAASGQEEAWLKIDLSKSKRKWKSSAKRIVNKPAYLQVRCIKVVLHGGGSMYLLTNLNSTELPVNQANELYDFRWREETSYDVDKNVLEVENFSSKTPNGVYQDYHAKILTVNITQLLINDAQVVLDQNQASKNNKHDYQINKRVPKLRDRTSKR